MTFNVPGLKPAIAQPSTMACWATVYTMMRSWKDQQSYTIVEALTEVGPKWLKIYQANTGLPSNDFSAFLTAAKMRSEPMMNPGSFRWTNLLSTKGLLWIGALSANVPGAGLHSRIIEGVTTGPGTPIRKGAKAKDVPVSFNIIDPFMGRRYIEPFSVFLGKFEGAIRLIYGEYYQIRHFA